MASDDPTYQAWVTEVMAQQSLFDAAPPTTERPPDWPPTRYEAKALREGRCAAVLDVQSGADAGARHAAPVALRRRLDHPCSHHAARTGRTTAPGIQSAVNNAASPRTSDGKRYTEQLLHGLVAPDRCNTRQPRARPAAAIAAARPAPAGLSSWQRGPSRRVSAVRGATAPPVPQGTRSTRPAATACPRRPARRTARAWRPARQGRCVTPCGVAHHDRADDAEGEILCLVRAGRRG